MQQPWITKHAPTTLVQCPCQALDTKDRTKILSSQSIRGTTFQKYYALQKLKKKALLTIAKHLSHDEVGSLEDIFRQVDEADEGVMSLTEIHDAILRGNNDPACVDITFEPSNYTRYRFSSIDLTHCLSFLRNKTKSQHFVQKNYLQRFKLNLLLWKKICRYRMMILSTGKLS